MDDLQRLMKKELAHDWRVFKYCSPRDHMLYLQIAQQFTDEQCKIITPLLNEILDKLEG